MGRLYGVLNVKIGQWKWPKRAILAVFMTFLKRPMREFAQIALKCSFSRARFTGAIGLDAQFRRGLARNKTRSADASAKKIWSPTSKVYQPYITHFGCSTMNTNICRGESGVESLKRWIHTISPGNEHGISLNNVKN